MAQIVHNDTLPGMWVLHTSNMKNWWLVNISLSWLHLLIMCMWISLSGDTPLICSRPVIHNAVQMYYIWTTCSQACGLGYMNLQRHQDKTRQVHLISWSFDLLSPFAAIGNVFWNAGFQGHCCLCTFHCSPIPVIHRHTNLPSAWLELSHTNTNTVEASRWMKTNSELGLLMRASEQSCQYRSRFISGCGDLLALHSFLDALIHQLPIVQDPVMGCSTIIVFYWFWLWCDAEKSPVSGAALILWVYLYKYLSKKKKKA